MRTIISIKHGQSASPDHAMASSVDFTMSEGEQIAIVGPNGSGKNTLVDLIRGRWRLAGEQVRYNFGEDERPSYKCIKMVAFRDLYGDVAGSDYYYQQRWHSQDVEFSPFLKDIIPSERSEKMQPIIDDLLSSQDGGLLEKRVVMLSSGERRRFQIAMSLYDDPRILILDNPFVGLDAQTRDSLCDHLSRLVQSGRTSIIMLLSKASEVPSFITHIVQVKDRICGNKITRADFHPSSAGKVLDDGMERAILALPQALEAPEGTVVELRDVCIQYAGKQILDHMSLSINKGDKVALDGPNGSGKSTLLSLVTADNPQSYACDISLFSRKRGTGESIWDIKKLIGYASPEMCRAFQKPVPVINVVASGYHDFAGLYRVPSQESLGPCAFWMKAFGIEHLSDRIFNTLSGGEQRLVMLARAFVKNPPLLILDEPMLELDERNCRLAKDIIETFCSKEGKTLIMVSHYPEDLPGCINVNIHMKKN